LDPNEKMSKSLLNTLDRGWNGKKHITLLSLERETGSWIGSELDEMRR
jgi:hypothetical protein